MRKNEVVRPETSSTLKAAKNSTFPLTCEGAANHTYPDWAAMQAYYGPGVAMPPPYFSTAVVPGHAPHPYVWAPQPLVPPFGHPYAAIYGGAFPHPPMSYMAAPLHAEKPIQDKGLTKKHKRHDGHVAPTSNVNGQNAAAGGTQVLSESEDYDTDNSTDGSDEYYATGGTEVRKKSISLGPGKARPSCGVASPPNNVILRAGAIEYCGHSIPDERERKRERRKQSNRESARRSRLRKQAEIEELASTVKSLSAENSTLKIELSWLEENSEQLRTRNAALMERLRTEHLNQAIDDVNSVGCVQKEDVGHSASSNSF